ncbi:DUF11 domain-containing protein [Candidatus Woesearchaeota archaeon]|nr:DUF11 domain-containing protein [Candidatus Woesearchaeota archaeon]
MIKKMYEIVKKYAAISVLAAAGCASQLASHEEIDDLVAKLVNTKPSNYEGQRDDAIQLVREADYNKDGIITSKELERFKAENPWIEEEYEKSEKRKKNQTPHHLIDLALKLKNKEVEKKDEGSVYTITPENSFLSDGRILRVVKVVYHDKDGDGKPSAGDEVEYTLQVNAPNVIGTTIRTFRDVIEEGEYAYTSLGEFDPNTGKQMPDESQSFTGFRGIANTLLYSEVEHNKQLDKDK